MVILIVNAPRFSPSNDAQDECPGDTAISEPNSNHEVVQVVESNEEPEESGVCPESNNEHDANIGSPADHSPAPGFILQVVDVINKIHEITGNIGKTCFTLY